VPTGAVGQVGRVAFTGFGGGGCRRQGHGVVRVAFWPIGRGDGGPGGPVRGTVVPWLLVSGQVPRPAGRRRPVSVLDVLDRVGGAGHRECLVRRVEIVLWGLSRPWYTCPQPAGGGGGAQRAGRGGVRTGGVQTVLLVGVAMPGTSGHTSTVERSPPRVSARLRPVDNSAR